MLFNSVTFAIFLPIVFAIYWMLQRNVRWQNLFVVGASYVFYGWWDWRFLTLIAFTSALSYVAGRRIQGGNQAKTWLTLAIVVNIAILALFKYYNFFVQSFADIFLGGNADKMLLNLILPVGISFYTFQAIGYVIDVYRKRLPATDDVVAFFAFVSFFPQLVAGPIERATHLLPQFAQRRKFNYHLAADGMRQMLWGLFIKTVVADRCGWYVDTVFEQYGIYSGGTLIVAALLFSVQIYGDFAGYSNIAIGCAKLFGIELMQNFKTPYFSRDIAEFWRRWHISLTSWFRDYLYYPLGGSRGSTAKTLRNTFIIFLVSGLWHGANWTFIAWGLYNAVLFAPLIVTHNNHRFQTVVASQKVLPTAKELLQMVLTFALCTVGWIIFRSSSMVSAYYYIGRMVHLRSGVTLGLPWITIAAVAIMFIAEWTNREKPHALHGILPHAAWLRPIVYLGLAACIALLSTQSQNFIYFQF